MANLRNFAYKMAIMSGCTYIVHMIFMAKRFEISNFASVGIRLT